MDGIVNNDGVLALIELTPEAIALGMTPDRLPNGFYSGLIMSHIESGEAYFNVSQHPLVVSHAVESNSVATSIKNNIKALDKKATKLGVAFPKCNIARINDNVVLVNVAAHLAKVAASKTVVDETTGDDTNDDTDES